MNYDLIGLAVKHPKYGYGIVKKKDKYGRYMVKFMSGIEIGALSESNIDLVSLSEANNSRLDEKFDRPGFNNIYNPSVYEEFVSGCDIVKKLHTYFESGSNIDVLKQKAIDIIKPHKIGHSDIVSAINKKNTVLDLFCYMYKLETNLRNDLKVLNKLLENIVKRI